MDAFGLDRRSLLRLAGLAGLGMALAPVLAACSSSKENAVLTSSVGRRPASPLTASTLSPFTARLADAVAPSGNLVLSGYSAAAVLGMIANGAGGRTAEEFAAVLGSPIEALNAELNAADQAMTAVGQPVAVTIANAFWTQQGYTFKQPFLDALAAWFGAGVHQVDFAQTAAAVDAVNSWAGEQTKGLIPEIVGPDQITPDLRMVLANAIHFKGSWADQFNPELTADEPFTTSAGTRVTVPMMRRDGRLPWLETPEWEAVALPFKGDRWAMVLALPRPDAPGTLTGLTATRTLEEVTTAAPAEVRLELPRWRTASDLDLKAPLQALGLNAAFDPGAADFSGMTDAETLFLGFILQKARIAVDETGAEAAAVTVGGMAATGMPVEQRLLRFDRTFWYALVHVPTRTSLFVGRVDDPTS